ncbi:hypothetical protein ACFFX0_28500 [Citricoccus parietis]|uniref:Uncharacterized protein n=1 Tax=Citricoccus parietis TaxID=592307 RepID=A0ABV5G7K1_9MICC
MATHAHRAAERCPCPQGSVQTVPAVVVRLLLDAAAGATIAAEMTVYLARP